MTDLKARSPILEALRIGFRAHPRLATTAVALAVVEHVADATPALILKLVVDAIVEGRASDARWFALGLAVAYIVGSLARNANVSVSGKLIDHTGRYIDLRLLEMAGTIPSVEHYERPEYLDRVLLLRTDRGHIARYGGAVIDAFGVFVRIAVTVFLLTTVDPALLALPLFAVPSLFTGRFARRVTLDAEERLAEPRRLAPHYYQLATESSLARELRIFGLLDTALHRHRSASRAIQRGQLAGRAKSNAITAVGTVTFTLGYVAAIAWVAALAARGEATAGDVALTVTLGAQVSGLTSRTVAFVSDTLTATTTVARYRWLLDYAARSKHRGHVPPPDKLTRGITLENVSFRYPGSEQNTLSNINLTVPAATTVALVGENGAGKTTLVKLLLGLYQPTTGQIRVDDLVLSDIDLHRWRERCTAAFQDHARYELTVKDAVGIGDLPARTETDRVEEALDRAHATEVTASLPGGLDQQLGRNWPNGTDLSGGQWQKVALARGLMRRAPLLMILDEPTAALDADSEYQLFEDQRDAAKASAQARGAISLFVSHRFSTVRSADLIVVLANGGIAEMGTHHELLTREGLYAELFNIQAAAYEQ